MPAASVDLDRALEVARAAAREAADLLREGWGGRHEVGFKGEPTNPVTEYDHRSEALIAERLRAAFPDHAILGEEHGESGVASPCRWLVDPLDGTVNFAHGLPVFAVSIALEVAGTVEIGVVRAPVPGWEFSARRGRGAWHDGAPIQVSDQDDLSRALLATGFPYDRRTSPDNNLDLFAAFQIASAVRRMGAASLDLCLVARGWLDGYWEMKLSPWDVAAGALIVVEAGGRVSDFSGRPNQTDASRIVASNGKLHDAILGVIASAPRHAGITHTG